MGGGIDGIAILNPELLQSTDAEEVQRINAAFDFLRGNLPHVWQLMQLCVKGIVLVDRSSKEPSVLDDRIDLVKATRGRWKHGAGRFVGSSTLHVGLMWIETKLLQSDLVCGLAHELVHTLVNLVDIAAGIFTPDAFDVSLLVPSPSTDGNRPYAMSMH